MNEIGDKGWQMGRKSLDSVTVDAVKAKHAELLQKADEFQKASRLLQNKAALLDQALAILNDSGPLQNILEFQPLSESLEQLGAAAPSSTKAKSKSRQPISPELTSGKDKLGTLTRFGLLHGELPRLVNTCLRTAGGELLSVAAITDRIIREKSLSQSVSRGLRTAVATELKSLTDMGRVKCVPVENAGGVLHYVVVEDR